MNSEALIKLHKEYDEAMLKQNENKEIESDVIDKIETKEFKLVGLNGETFDLLIQKDGMVNATMLCMAMGKEFYDYQKTKANQAYIQALQNEPIIIGSEIIQVRKGGDPKLQGTWIHRLLVIDVCRWGCPQFAVQITKWIDELLLTGSVQLKRPVKFLIELKQIDIEAEELELTHYFQSAH